jgi:hypothetical protein
MMMMMMMRIGACIVSDCYYLHSQALHQFDVIQVLVVAQIRDISILIVNHLVGQLGELVPDGGPSAVSSGPALYLQAYHHMLYQIIMSKAGNQK